MLSSTAHPNVVPLLGSSSDGPSLCLVYQFCEGGSLEQRVGPGTLPGRRPLSARQRVLTISDVARGLAHLHSMGLIHRDIKPANILLDGTHAKIGDFGIARVREATASASNTTLAALTSTATRAGRVAGTHLYMAPEYLKSGACSERVDSFAFGLTALVTLTGLRAEDRVRGGGGEQHESLLMLFEEELWDEPAALVARLDPRASDGGNAWEGLEPAVSALHGVIRSCLEPRKAARAEIRNLVEPLERIRADAEASRRLPPEFHCPLTLDVMRDPVSSSDGHTYERAEIERWLQVNNTSPITGAPLAHTHLVPNVALRGLIQRQLSGRD